MWPLSSRGGGKTLVAGPLKKDFVCGFPYILDQVALKRRDPEPVYEKEKRPETYSERKGRVRNLGITPYPCSGNKNRIRINDPQPHENYT